MGLCHSCFNCRFGSHMSPSVLYPPAGQADSQDSMSLRRLGRGQPVRRRNSCGNRCELRSVACLGAGMPVCRCDDPLNVDAIETQQGRFHYVSTTFPLSHGSAGTNTQNSVPAADLHGKPHSVSAKAGLDARRCCRSASHLHVGLRRGQPAQGRAPKV